MSTLGRQAARGGGVTLLGQLAKLIIQVANLIVLSRVLSPKDFGLVAMVTAVIGVGDVIRDLGLSSAAMQAKTLSRDQKSNLFWINLGLGVLLTFLTLVLANPIAAFYGNPALVPIATCLAWVFLLNGFQTQFQAELGRNMRFFTLAWTEVAALALGFGGAVLIASFGLGFWALVVQQLTQAFFMTVFRVSAARWWPGAPHRDVPMAGLLRYGFNLACTQVLVYASSNIDSVLIGTRFGSVALGYYNRAFQLLSVPLNQVFSPITHVALPVLSRLQDDAQEFMVYVNRAQIVLGHGVVYVFAIIIAGAQPLIQIVLGNQWIPSASILQVLAVGGAIQAVSYPAYWVFLARGLTGAHFRFSLISRSIVIALIVLGSFVSVQGVAAGYVVGMAVTWPLSLWWLARNKVKSTKILFATGTRVLAVGALACALATLAVLALTEASPIARVGVATVCVTGVYAILVLLIPALREDVKGSMSVIRLLRR